MNTTTTVPELTTMFHEEEKSVMDWVVFVVYVVYMPICVFVGLTGNAMVWLLIYTNRNLKKVPSNVYLLALAAISSVFLATVGLLWFELFTNRRVYSDSMIGCKLTIYLAHCCDFASVWLIALVCLERLVLLYKFKRVATVAKARRHVVMLGCMVLVLESWILVVCSENQESNSCDVHPEHIQVYTIMTVIETLFVLLVPMLLIFCGNWCCVLKLREYMKYAPRGSSVSFHPTIGGPHTDSSQLLTYTTSPIIVTTNGTNGSIAPRLRKAELTLTRSLLVVTTTFIVLNLPNYLYRTYGAFYMPSGSSVADNESSSEQYLESSATLDESAVNMGLGLLSGLVTNTTRGHHHGELRGVGMDAMEEEMIRPLAYTLIEVMDTLVHVALYSHHAVLFYLYIFYSPQMKKRLRPTATKLLECYCLKAVPDFGHYSDQAVVSAGAQVAAVPGHVVL